MVLRNSGRVGSRRFQQEPRVVQTRGLSCLYAPESPSPGFIGGRLPGTPFPYRAWNEKSI